MSLTQELRGHEKAHMKTQHNNDATQNTWHTLTENGEWHRDKKTWAGSNINLTRRPRIKLTLYIYSDEEVKVGAGWDSCSVISRSMIMSGAVFVCEPCSGSDVYASTELWLAPMSRTTSRFIDYEFRVNGMRKKDGSVQKSNRIWATSQQWMITQRKIRSLKLKISLRGSLLYCHWVQQWVL